jgi:hypothetical protein
MMTNLNCGHPVAWLSLDEGDYDFKSGLMQQKTMDKEHGVTHSRCVTRHVAGAASAPWRTGRESILSR